MHPTVIDRACLAAALLAALSGCASIPSPEQFRTRMDAAVARFEGQPIRSALVRLGAEDRRSNSPGLVTYVWRGERSFDTQRLNTITADGYIAKVSMLGNANFQRYAPAAEVCELQFDVGHDARVRIGRWSGNAAGCLGYAQALER